MSERIDITNHIFNNLHVLRFERNQNSHALYKCLCMVCNSLTYVTYVNLISGNTKSCQRCGQKATNYKQDCEILKKLNQGEKIVRIAKDYNVCRSVIYRIKKENTY